MELKKNKREDWQKLYADVRKEKNNSDLKVEVDIETVMQDMLSLRYFFAIARRLAEDNIISEMHPLTLNICAKDDKGTPDLNLRKSDDGNRLLAFLSNWQEVGYIRIQWNNLELPPWKWDYSSIFPCCMVAAPFGDEKGYRCLDEVYYNSATGQNEGDNRFVDYANALLSHLRKPEYYKGIVGNGLEEESKIVLVERLNQYFNLHLGEMNILSQIIWTFLLCGLLKGKSLYWYKKSDRSLFKADINERILSKSRLDAITYASGMYNAIENACLYSESKQAWFGFRVHRASRSAPPHEHLKEAQTREMLSEKYEDCYKYIRENKNPKDKDPNLFGSNDYSYFFEFYVLDNAFAGRGVLDTYNDRVFVRRKEKVTQYLNKQKSIATDKEQKGKIENLINGLPESRVKEPDKQEWSDLLEAAGAADPQMKYLSELEQIFTVQPRKKPVEDQIEDVTEHFGLRILKNIVHVSGGYLKGITPMTELKTGERRVKRYPNIKPSSTDPSKKAEDNTGRDNEQEETDFTEWNVIVPITDEWETKDEPHKATQNGESYFGENIQAPPKSLVYMSELAIFPYTFNQLGEKQLPGDKKASIKNIDKNISKGFSVSREANGFSIYEINTVKTEEIEVFCKALFASIVRRHKAEKTTHIALLMQNMDAILEVIRFFTAFYYNGGNDNMENVQIALCSRSAIYKDALTVDFLLMGSNGQCALNSAREYVYFHSENIAEQIPLLQHFSALMGTEEECNTPEEKQKVDKPAPKEQEKGFPESVFPFDIYLPQILPASENVKEPIVMDLKENAGESWFAHRIGTILNFDLRKKEFGCRLDDLHVRIGSKVHLDRFFEAELLFHNEGNVLRFAYLIAQDLLYGSGILNDGQSVLLLGYEKYSAPLMLQIEYWLRNSQRFPRVYTAVVYDHETRDEVKLAPYFDGEENRAAGGSLTVQSVVILPVATTLSTVYKVFNTAKKKLPGFFMDDRGDRTGMERQDLTADKYFSIVLVNSDLVRESEEGSDITRKYWKSIYRPNHEVVVSPERKRMKNPPSVRYFMPADGEWKDPVACPICRKTGKDLKPIVDTRKTGAQPKTILTLYGDQYEKHFLKAYHDTVGNGRVDKLYGNVLYSHLYERSNHFQYYVDYQSIYTENQEEIDCLLSECKLEREAFNVVVSPLQIRSSLFVRSVLNNAFEGSARFVYFDPDNNYREDFRSRFSYIAEEFKLLKKGSAQAKIRFHFADCSIVTGTTINRVRSLLQMLLTQSGIDTSDIVLFDHIFLMVNRSNYETINYYVQTPKDDFVTYIQLRIPSYNTQRDCCPACRLREKYELMAKCSSTLELRREFKKLISKHEKRSKEEYEQWQEENIFDRHSYLSWLFLWLYAFVQEDGEGVKLLTPLSEKGLEGKEERHAELCKCAKDLRDYLFARELPPEMCPNGATDEDKEKEWIKSYCQVMAQLKIKDLLEEKKKETEGKTEKNAEEAKKKYQGIVYKLFKDELIPVRNHMRISALHTIYSIMEKEPGLCDDVRRGSYRSAILKVVSAKLKAVTKGKGSDSQICYSIACKAEWLISYIKMLSREQFSNYYDYRQAIAGLLSDILTLMNRYAAERSREKNAKKKRTGGRLAIGADLITEDNNWKALVDFLQDIGDGKKEPMLCALYFYQIYMTVFHRLSDLQILSVTDAERVNQMLTMYDLVFSVQITQLKRINQELNEKKPGEKPTFRDIPLIEIPDFYRMLLRYLKAVKVATMSSGDATPCLKLANTYRELVNSPLLEDVAMVKDELKNRFLICTKYLYLENTQLMFEGMRNLNSLIQAREDLAMESEYPPAYRYTEKIQDKLGKLVREILQDCYSNIDGVSKREDILHQNLMAGFCEFWHCSTEGPTVGATEDNKEHLQITHMLQYYRLLEKLDEPSTALRPDDLPYYYEELSRTICGITSFKMCYIAYSCDGEYPNIIAQSGYYSPYIDDESILTPSVVERIIRLSGQKATSNNDEMPSYMHEEIIKGISVLLRYSIQEDKPQPKPIKCDGFSFEEEKPQKNTAYDYLVLGLPIETGKTFYIILQSHSEEEVLKKESDDSTTVWKRVLRKARDVLFMRRSLFEALKRDYTMLINLRFDCSYIRPAMDQKEPDKKAILQTADYKPSVMHISDLHMNGTEGQNILQITQEAFQRTLNSADCIPDLLVVSGDLVEGSDSDAKTAQQRYGEAAKLLRCAAQSLWGDREGYLPHDWRRRIVICTGNHDYATMNQYRPSMQHRVLTAAMPAMGESGTMAKFAYFVDFLIRFLDVPADEFLRNDLNEVREYRNLNLKCLVLNMSSAAMATRSNKLGVNRDALLKVLSRRIWDSAKDGASFRSPTMYKICVGHYSPLYEPNYGLDAYGALPGWEWDDERKAGSQINRLVKMFWDATMEEISNRIRQIKTEGQRDRKKGCTPEKVEEPAEAEAPNGSNKNCCFLYGIEQLDKAMDCLENGGDKELLSDCAKRFYTELDNSKKDYTSAQDLCKAMRKKELYEIMDRYRRWIKNGRPATDEEIADLLHDVTEAQIMGRRDTDELSDIAKEITIAGEIDAFFAGHIHEFWEWHEKDTNICCHDPESKPPKPIIEGVKNILVSSKFYNPSKKRIYGYLIKEMNCDRPQKIGTDERGKPLA